VILKISGKVRWFRPGFRPESLELLPDLEGAMISKLGTYEYR